MQQVFEQVDLGEIRWDKVRRWVVGYGGIWWDGGVVGYGGIWWDGRMVGRLVAIGGEVSGWEVSGFGGAPSNRFSDRTPLKIC